MNRSIPVVLVAAAVTFAACGLPEDDRPRAISAEDAPIALGTSTTVNEPATGTRAIDVWLIDAEGSLRPVERSIESPATVQLALEALLAAPNEQEDALLDTFIPDGTALTTAMAEDGTAVIQLGPAGTGVLSIQAEGQLRAFAQLVSTATEVPGVEFVRFVLEDGSAFAPPTATDEGNVDRPVSAADYAALRN